MSADGTQAGGPGRAPGAAIQAETQDLKQLVKLALHRRKRSSTDAAQTPLLFLASKAPSIPTGLIEDTTLAAMDKVIWMILRIRISETSGDQTLLSIAELARTTRIASRVTFTTSLAMLRCRRYLSVCATAWHSGGRKVGMAYALHAEQLPIVDAIFLDPNYASFLNDLSTNSVPRLRNAAQDELEKMRK